MPASRHPESLCRRCGRCCAKKVILAGRVIYTPFHCEHLDLGSRLCRVYERRHEVNPQCLRIERAIARGVLPADCPYVADRPDYVPPVEKPPPELVEELLRAAAAEFGLGPELVDRARAALTPGSRSDG